MIIDCHQCSTCYFEDKIPSSRIDPAMISPPQTRKTFENVLLAFVCIELYDSREEIEEAVAEFDSILRMIGKRAIVLCPNVHLSIDKAPEKQAVYLIRELEQTLKSRGFDIYLLSFGYHKQYGMECNGNVGSVLGRRFLGSAEKQFLKLLTRLGICPPDSMPFDMPDWAKTLTQRQLKVLGNRRETYTFAKNMLQEQLDATGNGEIMDLHVIRG